MDVTPAAGSFDALSVIIISHLQASELVDFRMACRTPSPCQMDLCGNAPSAPATGALSPKSPGPDVDRARCHGVRTRSHAVLRHRASRAVRELIFEPTSQPAAHPGRCEIEPER